ncbi:hypothetical protein CF149_07314 [Pseudomonas psychrophila]|nr:hypothetical protein CF149_07314 [Pseudomonas psychrophila]
MHQPTDLYDWQPQRSSLGLLSMRLIMLTLSERSRPTVYISVQQDQHVIVRLTSLTDIPRPDAANPAATSVLIALTHLLLVVLDLTPEGLEEFTDDLVRMGILRLIDTLG